jgi:hypothetical protein
MAFDYVRAIAAERERQARQPDQGPRLPTPKGGSVGRIRSYGPAPKPVTREDRQELNRDLSKSLAYRIKNDPRRAETWAAKLVAKLRALGALK